jgi:hypothetical protein
MNRKWFLHCCVAAGIWATISGSAWAAKIWESTFDTTADGVVDIFDNDAGKAMIGPVTAGRLQITSWDNSTNAFTPDKAGRPLGATLTGNDSMSADYKFSWSTLNQVEAQAYEAFGFLGSSSPQTRQILGGILRHWQIPSSGEYFVGLDIAAGSVGISGFGYSAGSAISLGTDPLNKDFELKVEYDGGTHAMSLTLLDGTGATLGSKTGNVQTLFGAGGAGEISNFALTHLGWSDYTGNGGDRATVWQVDSLAYYNTAQIPAVPEPSMLVLAAIAAGCVACARRTK